jgi:hypothetical protein
MSANESGIAEIVKELVISNCVINLTAEQGMSEAASAVASVKLRGKKA